MKKKVIALFLSTTIFFILSISVFADTTSSDDRYSVEYGMSSENSSEQIESSSMVSDSARSSLPSQPSEIESLSSSPKYYPIDIQTVNKDGKTELIKTYSVPSSVSPESLIEDFELGGIKYQFLYTKEVISETENSDPVSKLASNTVTVECSSKDLSTILKLLEPIIDYEDEEGYAGQLRLDTGTIYTEAGGKTSEKTSIEETVVYTDLERNDPYLIEKTITKNGTVLTLTDITWKETAWEATMPIKYKATCIYTGTTYVNKVTGYTATGTYIGEVRKKSNSAETKQYQLTYVSTQYSDLQNSSDDTSSVSTNQNQIANGKPTKNSNSLIFWVLLIIAFIALMGLGFLCWKIKPFEGKKRPSLSFLKRKKKNKTKIYMPSSMKPVDEWEEDSSEIYQESGEHFDAYEIEENFDLEDDALYTEDPERFTPHPQNTSSYQKKDFQFDPKEFMEEDINDD